MNKERHLGLLAVRQHYQQAASRHSTKRAGLVPFVKVIFEALAVRKTSKDSQLPHHRVSSQNSRDTHSSDCALQSQPGSHVHNFIHWCVPHSQYATLMFPLQCCNIKTDVDFFRALNNLYARSRTRYQALLSFKKPVALRFVKVRSTLVLCTMY